MIIDTHTLLWMDRDDPALGVRARQRIQADRLVLDWAGTLERIPADQ